MAGESAREEARRAREKAERLARRAAMFEKGAEGEIATAAVLADLPPGWTAIHDVRWPSRRLANIDHILVGPGGVFVIDSKNWSGKVSVANGHLRQNGHSREKAVAGCADAGLAIAELTGPHADKVFPVLCFRTEEPLTGWCRDVMVCSTSTLTQMLISRPTVLDPDASADAFLRVDAQLRSATAATPFQHVSDRAGRSDSNARRRSPATSRQSDRARRAAARRKRDLRRYAFGLLLALGFLAFGPQISSFVGGVLAEHATSGLTSSDSCPEKRSGDEQKVAKRPDGKRSVGTGARDGRGKATSTDADSAAQSDC